MTNRVVGQRTPSTSEQKTRYLYWWLLLALFFEYARPGSFVPVIEALRLNSIIPLGLLCASSFAKGLRSPKKIFADAFAKFMFAYVALIIFSLAYAEVTLYAYERSIAAVGYLILFWLIARIVTSRARVLGVFLALALAHVFLLAMSPEVVLDPSTRHYVQGATFLGDGNDFALSICILIPFAIDLASSTKSKWLRLLYYALLALLVLSVIGTSSRGGTLGMIAVAGYLWWHSPHKIKSLLAVSVIVTAALLYAPPTYFERMDTIRTYEEDSSAQARITAWKGAIRMAADNPILGVGAGQFATTFGGRYMTEPGRYVNAHSMYFLTLSELGLIGTVVVLSLIFGNMIAHTRVAKNLATRDSEGLALELRGTLRTVNASMLGFAVAGAFLSVSYYPHIFVLTGIFVATRALAAPLGAPTQQPAHRFAANSSVRLRRHGT